MDDDEDLLRDPISRWILAVFSAGIPGLGLLVAAAIADEDSVAHQDRGRLAGMGLAWLIVAVLTVCLCGLANLGAALHTFVAPSPYADTDPPDEDDLATVDGDIDDAEELETVDDVADDEVPDDGDGLDDTPGDGPPQPFTEEELTTWPRWRSGKPLAECDSLRSFVYQASKDELAADLSGPDKRELRNRALIMAAKNHQVWTVWWLLQEGVDVNHVDPEWGVAVDTADWQMARLLLDHGADPTVSVRGMSLIESALCGWRGHLVALFLEYGAPPEAPTRESPPHIVHAAQRAVPIAVEALIAAGADLSATDRDGLTALDHARLALRTEARDNERRVLAALEAAGAPEGALAQRDAEVREALGAHLRPYWRPVTEPGAGDPNGSRFGGRPWLPTGSTWPTGASEPFIFLFQLRLADTPEALRTHLGVSEGLLQVFIDAEDPFSGSGTDVRYVADGPGAVAEWPADLEHRHRPRRVTGWLTGEDPPGVWEASEGPLPDALAERLDDLFDHLIRSIALGDKVGGWPRWVQSPEYPACSACGRPRSTLVLQLGSDRNLSETFGDVGSGYVLACPDHPTDLAFVAQSH